MGKILPGNFFCFFHIFTKSSTPKILESMWKLISHSGEKLLFIRYPLFVKIAKQNYKIILSSRKYISKEFLRFFLLSFEFLLQIVQKEGCCLLILSSYQDEGRHLWSKRSLIKIIIFRNNSTYWKSATLNLYQIDTNIYSKLFKF